MDQEPVDCPEHVWSLIGVTVVDGTVSRIWDCERCSGWTSEPLDEDRRVPWSETALSQ